MATSTRYTPSRPLNSPLRCWLVFDRAGRLTLASAQCVMAVWDNGVLPARRTLQRALAAAIHQHVAKVEGAPTPTCRQAPVAFAALSFLVLAMLIMSCGQPFWPIAAQSNSRLAQWELQEHKEHGSSLHRNNAQHTPHTPVLGGTYSNQSNKNGTHIHTCIKYS